MSSITTGKGTGVSRALADIAQRRANLPPFLVPMLVAVACILGVSGALCSEFFSAGVGFNAAFPEKSDGTSLATDLMSLRYPIILCLFFGDVLLQAIPGWFGAILNRLLHGLGFWAILFLLAGIGAFMFSATFLTLGGEEAQGLVGHVMGLALAVASASMFTLSFLTSHALLSKLFTTVPVVAARRAERSRLRADERRIEALDGTSQRADHYASIVAELEAPGALVRKTANEAGVITGMVYAELHDLCASRRAMEDAGMREGDTSDVSADIPLAVLEQRREDLRPFTADYFVTLLKKDC